MDFQEVPRRSRRHTIRDGFLRSKRSFQELVRPRSRSDARPYSDLEDDHDDTDGASDAGSDASDDTIRAANALDDQHSPRESVEVRSVSTADSYRTVDTVDNDDDDIDPARPNGEPLRPFDSSATHSTAGPIPRRRLKRMGNFWCSNNNLHQTAAASSRRRHTAVMGSALYARRSIADLAARFRSGMQGFAADEHTRRALDALRNVQTPGSAPGDALAAPNGAAPTRRLPSVAFEDTASMEAPQRCEVGGFVSGARRESMTPYSGHIYNVTHRGQQQPAGNAAGKRRQRGMTLSTRDGSGMRTLGQVPSSSGGHGASSSSGEGVSPMTGPARPSMSMTIMGRESRDMYRGLINFNHTAPFGDNDAASDRTIKPAPQTHGPMSTKASSTTFTFKQLPAVPRDSAAGQEQTGTVPFPELLSDPTALKAYNDAQALRKEIRALQQTHSGVRRKRSALQDLLSEGACERLAEDWDVAFDKDWRLGDQRE